MFAIFTSYVKRFAESAELRLQLTWSGQVGIIALYMYKVWYLHRDEETYCMTFFILGSSYIIWMFGPSTPEKSMLNFSCIFYQIVYWWIIVFNADELQHFSCFSVYWHILSHTLDFYDPCHILDSNLNKKAFETGIIWNYKWNLILH